MLTVRIEQLTVRGLAPRQIRSLVGCSFNRKPGTRLRVACALGRAEPRLRLRLRVKRAIGTRVRYSW